MIKINDKYDPLFSVFKKDKYNVERYKDTRYILISGGRGSGKSYATNLGLTTYSYNKDMNILFSRYTMTSASTSIIPEFKDKIELLGKESDFEINKTVIRNLKSNCNIYFKGIKASSNANRANLKSLTNINIAVFEEAEDIPDFETFERIDLSVRSENVKNIVILIFNPTNTEHWIYKHFYEPYKIPDGYNGIREDKLYIHTSYLDNIDNLSDSYVRALENIKKSNRKRFDNIVMGFWNSFKEGLVFDSYNVVNEFPLESDLQYSLGIDFGYTNDSTSIVKIYAKKGRVYIQELLYKTHMTNSDIIKELKELKIPNHIPIICDSSEPKSIEDLKRAGFKAKGAKKGKDSIINGINYLKEHEINIVKGSSNIIREFNSYSWKKNNEGKFINVPEDKNNHAIDAIRYGIQHFKVKKGIVL